MLSCDGITITGNKSVDLISAKFPNCKHVYPVSLAEPGDSVQKKDVITVNTFLMPVLKQADECGFTVTNIVGDRPIRSWILGLKYSGFYSCEQCLAKGMLHEGKVVFHPDEHADSRDYNEMQDIILNLDTLTKIKNREKRRDAMKGIRCKSPIWDRPENPLELVNIDPMHAIFSGICERMLHNTFRIASRNKYTKSSIDKKLDVQELSETILSVRFPSEFSRRAREISNYKSGEIRNLILFLSPLTYNATRKFRLLQEVWTLMAFLIRVHLLEEAEYSKIKEEVNLSELLSYTEQLYLKVFGISNFTYNTHVFFKHLPEMRIDGQSLEKSSAFIFESSYSVIRHSFGTVRSVGLQILRNILLSKYSLKHYCRPSLKLKEDTTLNNEDSLIVNTAGEVLKIIKFKANGVIKTKKVEVQETHFYYSNRTKFLNLSNCGWWAFRHISNKTVYVRKKDIWGKAILVGESIMTCPLDTLHETAH